MTFTEGKQPARHLVSWRWLSWIAGATAVLAVCLAVRYFTTPSAAQAQARGTQARPAANTRTAAAPTASAPNGPAAAQPLPGIVAVVNGQNVSRDDLAHECLRRFGNEVLESMINRQLINDECRRRGINITEDDAWKEIERMAATFGLSTDRWLALFQEERNISPEEYQREIIWPMLALRRLAADQTEVSEAEVQQAFESEFGRKVRARIIVATTREAAENLLEMVKANPNDFGDIAKQYSQDATSASARGLIPPISLHIGDQAIEQAAFALKEGEISDIIPVATQFLILKCERQIPETFVAAQDMTPIRTRLTNTIRDQKLRVAASEMFRKLQEQAQVVNVFNDPELSRRSPGVAATINGRPVSLRELADECIQRHGEEVLDGEINRKILQQALDRQKVAVTEKDLDEEIRRAADAYGFLKKDGTPDVEAWLKHVTTDGGEHITVDLYVRDAVWPTAALKKLVGAEVQITEQEMQQGFESNYGERVEVLAVVLNSQRRAQQVFDMARNNPTEEFFADLAAQYSIEPVSQANGGRVPPIRRHSGNETLENEAFRLQPGEMSGVINISDKSIILRCLGRTEPVVKDIAAVRDELHKELLERKLRAEMAKVFDQLKESARLQTFLAGMVTRGRIQ